jgi:hypothetical protein
MQCLKEEMLNFLGQDVYITMDVLDKCPNKFGIPFQREEVPKVVSSSLIYTSRIRVFVSLVGQRPTFELPLRQPLTSQSF